MFEGTSYFKQTVLKKKSLRSTKSLLWYFVSRNMQEIYFFEWLFSPCGPWPLFSLLIYSQSVEFLGRVISSSQVLYLNTGQHKHRINIYTHQISMPWVGFEPKITASERAKTVHALDRSATVTGAGNTCIIYEIYNDDVITCVTIWWYLIPSRSPPCQLVTRRRKTWQWVSLLYPTLHDLAPY
jgi:hypothetical protein